MSVPNLDTTWEPETGWTRDLRQNQSWLGKQNSVPPLEVFLDHRRCQFRLLIPYCLGILTGVILGDFWDFTLHEFSASLQNAPPFLSSLSVPFLSIIPNLIPHVPSPPSCSPPWNLFYFPIPCRSKHPFLIPLCDHASLGLWMAHSYPLLYR